MRKRNKFLEMERVEGALKSSVRKEMAMRLTPPAFVDDLLAVSSQNGVCPEDFSVDDLLDLSNDDVFADEVAGEDAQPNDQPERASVSSEDPQCDGNTLLRCTHFSAGDDFGPAPTSELSVPADDLANLEWLSHFVDDSFSEYSAPYLTGSPREKPAWLTGDRKHPVTPVNEESCFKAPVPAKARSKRARTGGRVWSFGSPSFTDSSSSSTSSSSSSGPTSPWFGGAELLEPVVTSERPPVPKRQKKKPSEAVAGGQQPRRCSHCGVQKTPQWRAGPLGAKTLCNACGVRYKSGRLLPEYRPASSPTFSSERHSNHHRKVLEMRRKKDPVGGGEDIEPGLNLPVQTASVVPSF
ncbi:PREDICTED: GATA transcription factor 5 isoform X2 [Tarenaya hassleriana]|uniref:GATA transcription factor 5 isoform X2 n=1 Tax=Tarenaya hassleriana TaxID=28532 RepID=UPI00053C1F43|nr:PREDICTED: GATA transcription factor 5 isoform X2 [Tarenaya hassleriana]